MITNARTIQAACASGLVLAGQNDEREPEWIGNDAQWEEFKRLNCDVCEGTGKRISTAFDDEFVSECNHE